MSRKLLPVIVILIFNIAVAQVATAQKPQTDQHLDLRLEHAEVPMYPQLARTARIFGTVEVQVTVKDGHVAKTEVKSGPPVLTQATVENIQAWRFYPLVNATFTTKFIYKLEEKEQLDPQNPKVELQLPLLAKITAVPVLLDTKVGTSAMPTTH
jgi:TonB family protein